MGIAHIAKYRLRLSAQAGRLVRNTKTLATIASVSGLMVVAGNALPNLAAADDPTYNLSGTVTQADGQTPVTNSQVALFQDGNFVTSTQVGEDGSYSVDLAPGEYKISLSGQLNETDTTNYYISLRDGVDLTSNNVIENLQLPDFGTHVTLHTKDPSGNAVPNINGSYHEQADNYTSTGMPSSYFISIGGGYSTDANAQTVLTVFQGSNVFTDVNADYYSTGVTSNTVLGTEITNDADVDFVLPQTYDYTAHLQNANGNAISGAIFTIGNSSTSVVSSNTTDANGNVTVRGLADSYRLTVNAAQYFQGADLQIQFNDSMYLPFIDSVQTLQLPDLTTSTITVNVVDPDSNPLVNVPTAFLETLDNTTSDGMPGSYSISVGQTYLSDQNGQVAVPVFQGGTLTGYFAGGDDTQWGQMNFPDTVNGDSTVSLVLQPSN